jgi:hypothetical protein
MENYFYSQLNEKAVNAIRQDAAFFMNPADSRIPAMVDSYNRQPITGANYFNLQLSNDLSGKKNTEYVKMNEALSANIEWFSTLPRENRPRATVYQEEREDSRIGYSFVMPTAELNQNIYRNDRNTDNRSAAPAYQYVPYQSSGASMGNFDEFVHEQFTNALNASLTNCPFRNNIRPNEMDQFKTQLVDEISRNPAFMTVMSERARDEALNNYYLPFNRNKFIERARDETSPEFTRLNSTINEHVHDMYRNRRESFNPEFNELARPLVKKVEDYYLGNSNPRSAVDNEISGFVKNMIRQEKPAKVLADTFAGTFVEKAIKLAKTGKKVYAGVMIAGALIGSQYVLPIAAVVAGTVIAGAAIARSIEQIANFCKTASHKMGGDITPSRLDDVVKVAGNIVGAQELRGDRSLKTYCEQNDPRSFYAGLNQLIRDNPHALDQAIAQLNDRQHDRTQPMTRGQTMRR